MRLPTNVPRPDEDDPVEVLMASCLERPEAEHRDALERACDTHPEHAAELRRRFALLDGMGLIGESAAEVSQLPEQLGDFRPLSEIGSGGMGIVYRAEQVSLGREVAIKLVRPDYLYFPGARERFRREVEAVARLKHPGVVPVHAVGEERGLPYLAMELVEGCTLAEVLEQLTGRDPERLTGDDLADAIAARAGVDVARSPDSIFARSWAEAMIELVRQMADALAHAHEVGILHRDVKPSNVMVDARGRAMLLDFGLSSEGGSERLTRSGTRAGTLLYMAPEQVRGGELDARTDVYALGVTLYECLTLQPPHRGASALEIQSSILAGAPTPVRRRNPRVSRDAEAVCATALSPEPERRYSSARVLADDLANVLAHRPVLASPPGPWLALSRWTRRHPARAVALALGLVLLGGIPTALYLQQRGHSETLAKSLERETAALDDADATLAYLGLFLGAARPDATGGEELTVNEAMDYASENLHMLDDRPGVKSRVMRMIGNSWAGQDRLDEAIELLEASLALEQEVSGRTSVQALLVMDILATTLQSAHRFDRAEALFREALAGQIELNGPDHVAVGSAHNNLGSLFLMVGRMAEAEEQLRLALAAYEASGEWEPVEYYPTYSNLAHVLYELGRPAEGRPFAERALELVREKHARPHPDVAAVLNAVALIDHAEGDFDGAEASFREALAIVGQVWGPEHHAPTLTRRLLLDTLEAAGRIDAALELCDRTLLELEDEGRGDHASAAELRARIDRLLRLPDQE